MAAPPSAPDINGTWVGQLITDWRNEQGIGVPPIEFVVVVRQSFFNLHFTTFTNNFVALSYAETFYINKERGICRVAFLYAHDTTIVGENDNREGVTELHIITNMSPQMRGCYWSNTKTKGSITLELVSKKHAQLFKQAIDMKNDKLSL